jgi:hypothetical protein
MPPNAIFASARAFALWPGFPVARLAFFFLCLRYRSSAWRKLRRLPGSGFSPILAARGVSVAPGLLCGGFLAHFSARSVAAAIS